MKTIDLGPLAHLNEADEDWANFEKLMKQMDWSYAFSDDNRKFKAGQAQWKVLSPMINQFRDIDRKRTKELVKKYNKMYRADQEFWDKRLNEGALTADINEAKNWLPNFLDDKEKQQASKIASRVNNEIKYDPMVAYAIVVNLLEEVNAHDEAKKVNDLLFKMLPNA
jgi:hypothetical protein